MRINGRYIDIQVDPAYLYDCYVDEIGDRNIVWHENPHYSAEHWIGHLRSKIWWNANRLENERTFRKLAYEIVNKRHGTKKNVR